MLRGPIVPDSSKTGGNTRPQSFQPSPSKNWVFTLHISSSSDRSKVPMLCKFLDTTCDKYLFALELGDKGETPHFQGFCTFKKKVRALSITPDKTIHWEKMKGRPSDSYKYCTKEGFETWSKGLPVPLKSPITDEQFFPWQKKLWDILKEPCGDSRTIHWYWESKGNVGKSTFIRHLLITKTDTPMIVVSGRKQDIFHGIISAEPKPRIVFIDVSRRGKVNYDALESVKNGFFFSPKFESAMCLFEIPHIVVFSNAEPDYLGWSEDRFHVVEIGEETD